MVVTFSSGSGGGDTCNIYTSSSDTFPLSDSSRMMNSEDELDSDSDSSFATDSTTPWTSEDYGITPSGILDIHHIKVYCHCDAINGDREIFYDAQGRKSTSVCYFDPCGRLPTTTQVQLSHDPWNHNVTCSSAINTHTLDVIIIHVEAPFVHGNLRPTIVEV